MLRIGPWDNTVQEGWNLIHPTALGSIWEQVFRGNPIKLTSKHRRCRVWYGRGL